MLPLTKRWKIEPHISAEIEDTLHSFPPLLRQILGSRGYITPEAARAFLEASSPAVTDPFCMKGISEAVERLQYAIRGGEIIAIYGDYDADGVTATALLVQALNALGAQVQAYIPNRFEEGYGLNNEALASLHRQGVSVVVTVDCGIRSLPEVEYAHELGLDLIITDHHTPGINLPRAYAVINPKQIEDTYPDKDLAGVGLAYKLACALITVLQPQNIQPETFLDLVALGTVADLAPLIGENRYLVKAGLQMIRQPSRQGLHALMEIAGLKPGRVSATDIGYVLGPRLNAAGRLDSAMAAYELLTTNDIFRAGQLAQMLDVQNRERQQITRSIQEQAEQIALAENPDALLLFAAHPDFNSGVVGLAASRLTEQYYRPAIVAHYGSHFTRGSCRSIPEFDITEALDQCVDLLEHYGGHTAAAGFTIRNENLPVFVERLQSIASQQLSSLDLRPCLSADAEIPLSDLKPEYLKYLDWLQPTGIKNREVIFVSRGLQVKYPRLVGKDGAHLKISVTDGWITHDAIAFRQGYWFQQMPPLIDLMYSFEKNEYNGRETIQLNVRDLKPSGIP